jgi:signal transduction histidine kinase
MDMPGFLAENRGDLIARCRAKVALRAEPGQAANELEHGITPFLDQLIKTLLVEQGDEPANSRKVSGPTGGGAPALSEIGETAAAHGRELLAHGYTAEALVHDYGDLCQAITDLAVERGFVIQPGEFRIFNRCLDNAIAIAVTEFGYQRDALVAERNAESLNERLGVFAHELRNALGSATLAVQLIRAGKVGHSGSTGGVLDRSLVQMRGLIDRSLAEVRLNAGLPSRYQVFSVGEFVEEARVLAQMEADLHGCTLRVPRVDASLAVDADRDLLISALGNLLQNAFKYTRPGTEVALNAYALADRVLIDVEDHCGGLPRGEVERLFVPFVQAANNRSGVGLGLGIARRSVEANQGMLRVRDMPGIGCVFTIDLPRRALPDPAATGRADPALA